MLLNVVNAALAGWRSVSNTAEHQTDEDDLIKTLEQSDEGSNVMDTVS